MGQHCPVASRPIVLAQSGLLPPAKDNHLGDPSLQPCHFWRSGQSPNRDGHWPGCTGHRTGIFPFFRFGFFLLVLLVMGGPSGPMSDARRPDNPIGIGDSAPFPRFFDAAYPHHSGVQASSDTDGKLSPRKLPTNKPLAIRAVQVQVSVMAGFSTARYALLDL